MGERGDFASVSIRRCRSDVSPAVPFADANVTETPCSLVDLFSTTSNASISNLKSLLVNYHRLLISSRLSNEALTDLPLPQTLDPTRKVALPSRFSTMWLLIKDTLITLYHLPFFLVPMIVHLPIYGMGILGARLVEDELETQAMMKVVFGLILSVLTYPILFFVFWTVFKQVPLGAMLAAGIVWLLRQFHSTLIDENYNAWVTIGSQLSSEC